MIRRIIRLVSATALALASFLVAPAVAEAAPEPGTLWILHHDPHPDGSTIDVGAANLGVVWFTVGVDSTWKGWSKLRSRALTFSTDNLLVQGDDELTSWMFPQWTAYNTSDPSCSIEGYDSRFTVPKASCANAVRMDWVIITWDTPPETLTSNLHAVRIRAGRALVRDGKGRTDALRYDTYEQNTGSLSVDSSTVSSVTTMLEGCVDESLVHVGDVPRVTLTATVNGIPAQTSSTAAAPTVGWTPAEHYVFPIHGEAPLQNIVARFEGAIALPENGVVTVQSSVDLTRGSRSVLEPCPSTDEQFFPPVTAGIPIPALNALTALHPLPSALNWVGDISSLDSQPDGHGGLFLVTYGDTSNRITHTTADGADEGFAGSGSVDWTHTPQYVTRYGPAGESWMAYDSGTVDEPTTQTGNVLVGSMTAGGTTTTSLTEADADSACQRPDATAGWIEPLSAPTALPLIRVTCQYGDGFDSWTQYSALAFIDTAHDNSVTPLVSLTPTGAVDTTPNTYLSAVNPHATGSQTAFWSYTENVDLSDYTTVVNRLITTVAADGTVTQTPIDHDPFGGRYASNLDLVPGLTAGSWVGVGRFSGGGGSWGHHVVTVTGDTTIAVSNDWVSGLARADSYASLTPISALSDTRFLALQSTTDQYFDGDTTSMYQAFVLDATNPQPIAGREVSTTVSAYASTPQQERGWDSSGFPVLYNPISRTELQVVTWVLGK